jgi:hypothetical protein
MESTVDIFKERLNKMDTTDLETNQENLETLVVHQKVRNEGATMEALRAQEDQSVDEEKKSRPGTMSYDEPLKDKNVQEEMMDS